MKYIKYFEGKSNLFIQIEGSRIKEVIKNDIISGQHGEIKFSKNESIEIDEKLPRYLKKTTEQINRMWYIDVFKNLNIKNYYYSLEGKNNGIIFQIAKLLDDYYVVYVHVHRDFSELCLYYKCDGIDGIVNCIEYVHELYPPKEL